MYGSMKSLAALAAAAALFSAACATQAPTGAQTGAPERPGVTPTAAAAPAPTTAVPTPGPAATAPATTTTPSAGTTPGATAQAGSPTAEASPAVSPTAATAASPTAASGGGNGNPTQGRSKFTGDAGCSACHGERAQGGVFPGAPKLSGTALTEQQVHDQVRTPRDPSKGMPPFSAAQVSDQDIKNMYAWFKTNP